MTRAAPLLIVLLATGCNTSAPPADMPAHGWKYYVTNPAEIEPMQKVCEQWSGSKAPAGAEPAVVAGNCRAAAFANSMIKSRSAGAQ